MPPVHTGSSHPTHPPCFWQKSPQSVENKGPALQNAHKSPQDAEKTRLERETELECAARKHEAAKDTVIETLRVRGQVRIKRMTEELAVAAPPGAIGIMTLIPYFTIYSYRFQVI